MDPSAVGRPAVRRPIPGTAKDDQDMRRMHKAQELNVSLLERDAEDEGTER